MTSLISSVTQALTQPKHSYFPYFAALVLVADAALCQRIIARVPFTEIDFATYLQQSSLVWNKGIRDYADIRGDSGPLVYPAGHVAFFGFMDWISQSGQQLWAAQQVFATIYTVTQAVVACLFYRAEMPAWALFLLPLSKRLHSIYLLRCFNDPVAMLFLYGAVLSSTYKKWSITSLLFSSALSLKMNILFFLPALLYLCTLDQGFTSTIRQLLVIVSSQVLISLPFTLENAASYVAGAFDLHRAFLYRWTVNWRFLPEHVFLNPKLWLLLLSLHVVLLYVLVKKWSVPHGGAFRVAVRVAGGPRLPAALSRQRIDSSYIASVWFTANLVGVVCARSLHYQFYSWYVWQALFLAVNSRYPCIFKLALLAALETCWNVYPATAASSAVLLLINLTLLYGALQSKDFWNFRRRGAANRPLQRTNT